MSRQRLPGAIFALALGTGSTLVASDSFSLDDVRLTITRLPSSQPIHAVYEDQSSSATEDTAGLHPGVRADLGACLRVAHVGRSTALILSLAVFDGQAATAEDDNRVVGIVGPIKVGTQGLDVGFGLAERLSQGFHIEVVPFLGLAFAKLSDRAVGGVNPVTTFSESGQGTYSEYGVRTGIYYTGDRNHLQIGLGLAYLVGRTEGQLNFNETGGGVMTEKLTIGTRGLAPSLSFGYRF